MLEENLTTPNNDNYDLLTISLAGHIVAFYSKIGELNRNLFKKYIVEASADDIEHTVTIERNLINGIPFGDGNRTGFFLIHKDISDWLITKNVLTAHASAIAFNGKAYLFSAPSGTGKSTHTRLWRNAFGKAVRIISDDQPLIRLDENGIFACGSIWNGKAHLGNNIKAPIGGICLLSRSETNSITRMTASEALAGLLPNVYIPNEPLPAAQALKLMQKLISTVPVYSLRCNMQPDAAVFSKDNIVIDC